MQPPERAKRVIFVDEPTRDVFVRLKRGTFEEKRLFGYLESARRELQANPFSGRKVKRELWPQTYTRKYCINNLWKYNLSDGWRLIYTIRGDAVEIVAVVLEWMSHKEYAKRFGYKLD